MEFLVSSQGRLQDVQNRFLTNITSLFELEHAKEEHEVMVPITNTVYAAGRMVSKDKVTIDVGTGYYVEMVYKMGRTYVLMAFGRLCLMPLTITRERLSY